ncbi:MAG: NAD-dependent malic enzyme [Streptococcaceae bacterium]|nr:NAD-dependent malic enzyme [Streptococcaceae bacterium]
MEKNETYGKNVLTEPFINKGTAFTDEERTRLHLHGLLPAAVETLSEQVNRACKKLSALTENYAKNQYLMSIYNSNRTLYYAIVGAYTEELLPVIYTPTIADAVTHFSRDFVLPHDAAYLDTAHPERIEEALKSATASLDAVDVMVITDGEGVLGIGDWGVGGVMISVGKLAVYTVASGLDPRRVLPVVIDNGTANPELLADPDYIGKKVERKTGGEYLAYIDEFVKVASQLFPDVLFHWEDFGRGNAATILETYQDKITTFNDDIQGTGIMMAAAVYAVAEVTEKTIDAHRYLIFGGGTAGIGIADQIRCELMLTGLTESEAYDKIYIVDRFGLVTQSLSALTEGQKRYARREPLLAGLSVLTEIIEAVKPSVLIGCSGQPGAFTEEAVRKMLDFNERPAILPISNPTKLCEATAEDLIKWTNGKALVVTGSPSSPVFFEGHTYVIGQANNALLYPGLGLGIVVAKASTVTENMLSKAAGAISSLQDLSQLGAPILPPLKFVREASRYVAQAVVQAAIDDGVATRKIQDVQKAVEQEIWSPRYD